MQRAACDVWNATRDVWNATCDVWNTTCRKWSGSNRQHCTPFGTAPCSRAARCIHVCSVTGVALALLPVAHCPLHAACCMLQAAWCMQHDAYSMVPVACCMMPVLVARDLWHGKGHRGRCSTPACCILPARCSLPVACCCLYLISPRLGLNRMCVFDTTSVRRATSSYSTATCPVPFRSVRAYLWLKVDPWICQCDLCIEAPVNLSFHLSVDLSISSYLSTYPPLYLPAYLPIYQSSFQQPTH